MRLLQHALGEVEAVVGEARHVGIEIERAVDRQELVEAGLRQALEQDAAVLLVAVLDRLHLGAAVERRLRRDLRQRRHRDREIALQPLDRPHQRLAAPPSSRSRQPVMQKYFENELMTTALLRQPRRGLRRHRVVEPVIDLVGDDADAERLRRRAISSASACGVIMVPVGLAGLATSTPASGARACAARSMSPVIAQRVCRRGLDQHRLAAERGQDVAVRRIARRWRWRRDRPARTWPGTPG